MEVSVGHVGTGGWSADNFLGSAPKVFSECRLWEHCACQRCSSQILNQRGVCNVNGRGSFDIVMKEKASQYWGIMEAHISSKAVAKVYEVANLLPQTLRLEEARRGFDADSWPRQFQKSPPDDDSIALYFFASNTGRSESTFSPLCFSFWESDQSLRLSWPFKTHF